MYVTAAAVVGGGDGWRRRRRRRRRGRWRVEIGSKQVGLLVLTKPEARSSLEKSDERSAMVMVLRPV